MRQDYNNRSSTVWAGFLGLPVGLSCLLVAVCLAVVIVGPFLCCGGILLVMPKDKPAHHSPTTRPAEPVRP